MEGVGARLGRSSTRFGAPTSVFTGPVRKWTKRWVPLPKHGGASSTSNPKKLNTNDNVENEHHLFLYKWMPVSSSQPNASTAATSEPADPPKRRVRYVPVSVNEGQNQDASENSDTEDELNDAHSPPQANQADASNAKADASDVMMEEAQASDRSPDDTDVANETELDLNFG